MIIFRSSLGVSFLKSRRHFYLLGRVARQSFGQCCTSESFECCYLHMSANILLVFVSYSSRPVCTTRTRPTLLTVFFYTHAHTRIYRPTYVNWITLFTGTLRFWLKHTLDRAECSCSPQNVFVFGRIRVRISNGTSSSDLRLPWFSLFPIGKFALYTSTKPRRLPPFLPFFLICNSHVILTFDTM